MLIGVLGCGKKLWTHAMQPARGNPSRCAAPALSPGVRERADEDRPN